MFKMSEKTHLSNFMHFKKKLFISFFKKKEASRSENIKCIKFNYTKYPVPAAGKNNLLLFQLLRKNFSPYKIIFLNFKLIIQFQLLREIKKTL